MEVREYVGTTSEEVESKKHNIFIAICLGNKFFLNGNLINEENITKYLSWALKNTKDKVLILVADKVQATNYNVRNKKHSKQANLRRVLRDGAEIKLNLEKLIEKFPKDEQNKIKIIRWEEYEKQDPYYKKTTNLVYEEFENNKKFKNAVFNVIKTTITDRKFTEEKYWALCNYILDEFYLLYSGIKYEGDYYGLLIYPFMDSTGYFIEDIKKRIKFSELADKLPEDKCTYAIMN